MSIGKKISLFAFSAAMVPIIIFLILLGIIYQTLEHKIRNSVTENFEQQLITIADNIYELCKYQHTLLNQSLNHNMNVAKDILARNGGIVLLSDTIRWTAVNQFTKEEQIITLPQIAIGESVLLQNYSSRNKTHVVDDITFLVEGTCTIFQRMNKAGDMLRIATNVIGKDGRRAIGTYIPSQSNDEASNKIIQTVLRGERYIGRAFVVDDWYLAAYEPIKNSQQEIIGMLYTGVQENKAVNIRDSILRKKIGKTGYVFVLGGSGSRKGQYIISKDGQRDGENIWMAQDSKGEYFIQKMINDAVILKGNQIIFQRYPWKNIGENSPREKTAAIAYFAPWDWVIGISSYRDEVDSITEETVLFLNQIIKYAIILCGICFFIIIGVALRIGRDISGPINNVVRQLYESTVHTTQESEELSTTSRKLSSSIAEQSAILQESTSCLQQITTSSQQNVQFAVTANQLAQQAKVVSDVGQSSLQELQDSMENIRESSNEIRKIIAIIEEIAAQTHLLSLNSAIEAARAGEYGKGFNVVAEEVRSLAKRSSQASQETAERILDSINKINQGTKIAKDAYESLKNVQINSGKVVDLMAQIESGSKTEAENVKIVSEAIRQITSFVEQNNSMTHASSTSAERLNEQVENLNQMIDVLKKITLSEKER